MILTTNTTIAIQCSRCGELEYHSLSMFAHGNQAITKLNCRCGEILISLSSRERKQFNLTYPCVFCGQTHFLRLKRTTIWGKKVLPLLCSELEAAVGFIGPKQKVMTACRERQCSFGDLTDYIGYDEEFENPEVMLRILDHLHGLAKRGSLGCRCGNKQLIFDLLPDRIELYCELCDALGIIHTDNEENIVSVEGMNSFYLRENKTWQINRPWAPHLAKKIEEE